MRRVRCFDAGCPVRESCVRPGLVATKEARKTRRGRDGAAAGPRPRADRPPSRAPAHGVRALTPPPLAGSCVVCTQTMQKVVFIKQALTEELANNMIALTLYLDSLDNKRIYYWLNCPGGEVRAR